MEHSYADLQSMQDALGANRASISSVEFEINGNLCEIFDINGGFLFSFKNIDFATDFKELKVLKSIKCTGFYLMDGEYVKAEFIL